MPTLKDYYKILGVAENADAEAIKKAYRKLARTYHPDRNPDDAAAEDRFKEIQEAHDILGDPKKRKEYDMMRKNPFGAFGGFQTTGGGQYYQRPDGTYVRFDTGGAPGGFGDGGFGGLGDIFSRLFGGEPEAPPRAGGPRRAAQGHHAEVQVTLSLEEALQGGKAEVTLPTGERVRVPFPKGVPNGFKVRLKGRGYPQPGGRPGHAYVTFDVTPHPDFRRESDDLYTTVTIPVFEALLGTSRSVTNAYGSRVKVPIAAGTQPGSKLRLKGQGVRTDKGTGDLYVEIAVTLPEHLTPEQKKALQDAAKLFEKE